MTATPKRDSLIKRIGKAREREHRMIANALLVDTEAEQRLKEKRAADGELLSLESPYHRLCFICKLRGHCKHREPLVEAAYAEVKARRRL